MAIVQSTEVDFQLHTLGWKAFQDLCATICSEVLGQTFQNFFPSRDGGRDGAVAGLRENRKIVTQCKFFSDPRHVLKLADLADELEKARTLKTKNLCDSYVVMTNAIVTGENAAKIESEFIQVSEVSDVTVHGVEWITLKIRETARLRALVPRIYGLGDISQIIDERALTQARELLSSIQDELGKFVITNSYRQAAKAVMDRGFVFLLGEPLCGKSMTAACLAVSALDQKHAQVFKLTRAADLEKHWNPNERRLFWFDDVFGPTQYSREMALDWINYFPHLNAAIKGGNRVIFTSRSYIYDAAIRDIKAPAFPLLRDSQVVIRVEDLALPERKQILYNHLKLGSQNSTFKKLVKPFLNAVAGNTRFQPEIARRLGSPDFTKRLSIDEVGLIQFVEQPKAFLVEIVESLDAPNFAALGLLFLNGGRATSPLLLTEGDKGAVSQLGSTEPDVVRALNAMRGSLVILVIEDGDQVWKFKHPTIADAVAEVVSRNPEYIDIYLRGAKSSQVLREVVCGEIEMAGAKLRIPKSRFKQIVAILGEVSPRDRNVFLSNRCDQSFLAKYLEDHDPSIFIPASGYLDSVSETYVLVRLQLYGLLPESVRKKFFEVAKELALLIFDFSFYNDDEIRNLLHPDEVAEIVKSFAEDGLENISSSIRDWQSDVGERDDPDSAFEPMRTALNAVEKELGDQVKSQVEYAMARIDEAISDILEARAEPERDWDDESRRGGSSGDFSVERDIFDDVDK